MFEKYIRVHLPDKEMHRAIPLFHWFRLCGTDNRDLLDEFDSNYLGTWPDRDSLATTIQEDMGWSLRWPAQCALDEMELSGELALVLDEYGVHAFISPSGPKPPQDPNAGAGALPIPEDIAA